MSASIKRYWAMVLGSMAGPAFIVSGIVSAIAAVLGVALVAIRGPFGSATLVLDTLQWLIATISALALLAGLAATYNRWAVSLNWLGRRGLLLAAIGEAALISVEALEEANYLVPNVISLIFRGSPGYQVANTGTFIGKVLALANEVAFYAFAAGMVLAGIYVLRTNANLLPGWAKSLPLIYGLWRLFWYLTIGSFLSFIWTIVPTDMPLETRSIWVTGLQSLLGLPEVILLVLLGLAFLSRQSTLPLEAEPAPGSFEAALERP